MTKHFSVSSNELKTMKLLSNCASTDKKHPVLQAFNVHQDGRIETADGFRLAWVYSPGLAAQLLQAVNLYEDAMVKVEKVGRIVSVAEEPEEGSYPETERIYDMVKGSAATLVVDAQAMASALSGFSEPLFIGYSDNDSPIELRGKDKAGNEAYAVLSPEKPERPMLPWDPNHR